MRVANHNRRSRPIAPTSSSSGKPSEETHLRVALVFATSVRNPHRRATRYWRALFEALSATGISVDVFQPRCLIIPLPRKGRKGNRSLAVVSPFFLISLTRRRPSFVLSTEYGLHTLFALVAARLSRVDGLIFKEHADCAGLSRVRLLHRKLLTALASGTIANTEAARREVECVLGADPMRVHLTSLLVPPMIADLTQEKLDLSLPAKRPVFLFAGQIVEQKNVEALLQASAILRQDDLTFSVWVVGDGPLSSALEQMALDLGLRDTVVFSRSVRYESVGHLYSLCDVFVMPSLHDYKSMAVLEALRFGKPIIDSTCDGNAGDSVLDGVNGFLFEPTDIGGLAWAMRQFVTQPELTQAMSSRAGELMGSNTPMMSAKALRDVLIRISQQNSDQAVEREKAGQSHG